MVHQSSQPVHRAHCADRNEGDGRAAVRAAPGARGVVQPDEVPRKVDLHASDARPPVRHEPVAVSREPGDEPLGVQSGGSRTNPSHAGTTRRAAPGLLRRRPAQSAGRARPVVRPDLAVDKLFGPEGDAEPVRVDGARSAVVEMESELAGAVPSIEVEREGPCRRWFMCGGGSSQIS